MEQLSLHDAVAWEPETQQCTLCDHADDAGSAMAYLKQMDTAQGGRVTDAALALMMLESYNTFFRKPMVAAGHSPPELTEQELTTHFTEHDINPLRQLRKDLKKINAIQDALKPRETTAGGNAICNEEHAKMWANMQRLKMDTLKQYEISDRHTSRDMPTLG